MKFKLSKAIVIPDSYSSYISCSGSVNLIKAMNQTQKIIDDSSKHIINDTKVKDRVSEMLSSNSSSLSQRTQDNQQKTASPKVSIINDDNNNIHMKILRLQAPQLQSNHMQLQVITYLCFQLVCIIILWF